jgi:hypothetical protein
MRRALGFLPGRLRAALLLVALGAVSACGGDRAAEEEAPEPLIEDAAVISPPPDTPTVALRRFLPDAMQRSTRPETFPHEAHVQISCAVCHQVPQGHGSHASVDCAACHRASQAATVRALAPAQCAACHHGADQDLSCAHCHESRGVVQSSQQLALEVWPMPRQRTLTFDHGRHAQLDCGSCHQSRPMLTPAAPCASCHEDHHVATVRCQSCHTAPPETAHGVEAHLTCSGSGCHQAPDVEAIVDTRAVCLVCHQAQEDHEPGGRCVECHRVGPGIGARSGP